VGPGHRKNRDQGFALKPRRVGAARPEARRQILLRGSRICNGPCSSRCITPFEHRLESVGNCASQFVRRYPSMPRSTLCAPNAIRHAGAPEFAAARLPSWRWKWMRLARHKIALAWSHTGSNHSASVRACSNAMPLPWAASFAIHFPTTYRSNGGFSHTRPSHGTDKPFCVRVLFAQSHGRGSAPAGSRSNGPSAPMIQLGVIQFCESPTVF
jgi:hypothetical protein